MGKLQKKKDPRKKKLKNAADPAQSGSPDTSAAKRTKSVTRSGPATTGKMKKNPAASGSKSGKQPAAGGVKKYIDDSIQFLREVRVELKKVTWPSRQQTLGSTAVVLALVIVVSFFLGIVDFALTNIMQIILG